MEGISKGRLATGILTVCGLFSCFYDVLILRRYLHTGVFGEAASIAAVLMWHVALTLELYSMDVVSRRTEPGNNKKPTKGREPPSLQWQEKYIVFCAPVLCLGFTALPCK